MIGVIAYKNQDKIELTKEELRFLYETDEQIIDPQNKEIMSVIQEIRQTRNKAKDLAYLFDCSEEEIGFKPTDLTRQLVYYYELANYICDTEELPKYVFLPKIWKGSIDLSKLTSSKDLKLPERINGSLDLRSITNPEYLILPKYIGDDLFLNSLTTAKNLKFPEHIGGRLNLHSLTTAEGLSLPGNIGSLGLAALTSANGLKFPDYIGWLDLGVTSIEGTILPSHVGNLDFYKLENAEGLKLPKRIDGKLCFYLLKSLKGIELPEYVGEKIYYKGENYSLIELKQLQKYEEVREAIIHPFGHRKRGR